MREKTAGNERETGHHSSLSAAGEQEPLTDAQDEREAELAALRRLDVLKKEFFSTVSHELRTPLTVLHGYIQHLQARAESLSPEAVAAIAGTMLTASTQLQRLVEDMLDLSQIERGEVSVRLEDFNLVPILHDVLAGFRQQPGGDRLASTLPDELVVRADRVRVMQIVSNLVANALKYAPEGPVVLRARQVRATAGAMPLVRVEVEDQGPGIAPEAQPHVWEKFFRGAGVAGFDMTRGTGIGLAVAKALVEAQSGRVGLKSAPGSGAQFWFELPAPARGEPAP